MGARDYYTTLARRICWIVILVSLAPLVSISAITAYQFHTAFEAKALAYLKEIVSAHKKNIDDFLGEKLAGLNLLADTCSYERLNDAASLDSLLSLLQKRYHGVHVDLGAVNAEGEQVAYAGPFRLEKARYGDAAWFRKTIQTGSFISDVFLGLRGMPHFVVAVKRDHHESPWILRSTIDFVAFNKIVEDIRVGETGQAFIVNRQGEVQTHSRAAETADIPALLARVETIAASKAEAGRSVVAFPGQKKGGGKDVVYVMTLLKNQDWVLVVQQDDDDAFRDLYRARFLSVGVLILGSVAIVFTALELTRRMVSHIARADREKELMNEKVKEAGKLASLGELAAGIAHEINNPVTIMVEEAGWVQDLMDDAPVEAMGDENIQEINRSLGQIKTQGARCKEITYKLLSFARKTDPTPTDLNVNALVREIAGLSDQRARLEKVHIRLNLDPNLPPVAASSSEMQQVMLNCINNGVDAMAQTGGELVISTRHDETDVFIEIADTGHGIPESHIQRIFDPFYTTKAVGKGTGLGLSICYGIISKMGGDITVQSVVGEGATFSIRIPASSYVHAAPHADPAPAGAGEKASRDATSLARELEEKAPPRS